MVELLLVTVYTSHLESCRGSADLRCAQFQYMYSLLKNSQTAAIFCGDTNLSFNADKRQLDEVIAVGAQALSQLDDAYTASGASTVKVKGVSLSSTWSRMGSNGRKNYSRFDRFYSSKNKGIRVCNVSEQGFQIIGRESLPAELINANESGYDTPSDHFGLIVKYEITPVNSSSLSSSSKDVAKISSSNKSVSSSSLIKVSPDVVMGVAKIEDTNCRIPPHLHNKKMKRNDSILNIGDDGDNDTAGLLSSFSNAKRRTTSENETVDLTDSPSDSGYKGVSRSTNDSSSDDSVLHKCPDGYDIEVWNALPKDIQKELVL